MPRTLTPGARHAAGISPVFPDASSRSSCSSVGAERSPRPSTSDETRSSTRTSRSRCSRQITSTSISMMRSAKSAARVGRMAERWYARLSKVFDHEMRTRQPLVLYASHPDFEQTNVVGGMIGEGTGGVTEGLKRRVVLPLAGTLQETDHVSWPRARACIPIRHFRPARPGRRRRRRHRKPAALVRRRIGRIPVDWAGRLRIRRCGCAMRRARRSCRR